MKKLSMLFMVIFLFGLSATGHTSEECLVFEKVFERTTKASVAKLESEAKLKYFQALSGDAIVRVYNGAEQEAKKVSSATIYINGIKVVGPSDFNQNVDYIEKMADLSKGQNSVEVFLKSKPGGKIKVSIVKPKYLALDDFDCDTISCDGDESGFSGDNPCTGGSNAACDDNCPNDFNPDQADSDGDKIGDICDANDTYPNTEIDRITVGGRPYGEIAISPDGLYAFVSNYYTNMISVIKTIDKSVIEITDDSLYRPYGVSVTPDGKYVYVSNIWNNSVSVIQTSDNTVIDEIPVGDTPYGVSMTTQGDYVYVCNSYDDSVSVIETSSHNVDTINDVGIKPYGVSVTPDGAYAYVTNSSGGNVSVIQTSSKTVIKTIDVGDGPQGVSVTPDGAYVYVSNFGSDTVSVIRTSDNSVKSTISVGINPHGVSVTPDGAYVYVNNFGSDTVSVIRTSNNTVIDTIKVGSGPLGGIAVSPPDGESVYVSNYKEGTVSVIGF